jgi:DNA-binding CsgD family transcriptional regulator
VALNFKFPCLIFISFLMVYQVRAQTTIGVPAIKNYTHADYKASTDIWCINQDSKGIIYLGNNDGLLTFDGSYWKTYQMPNKGTVRSLAIDPSGRIYVGGQDEIGYFLPDEHGILKFHSIKNLLPPVARQFAEILNIVFYKNEVFFRTVECLFEYDHKTIKTYDAMGGWRFLSNAGSQLIAEDREDGFMTFKDHRWESCGLGTKGYHLNAIGIMGFNKDTVLVSTFKSGFFLLAGQTLIKKPTELDGILQNDRISCARQLNNGLYAIGSTSRGLFVMNNRGKLVDHYAVSEGLQNNNVHQVLFDRDQNLWLGLESGLDFINYNTSVKRIYPDKNNQLKSTAVSVFDQKLFIGTSNGLFSVPTSSLPGDITNNVGTFTEVKETKGNVLSLSVVKNNLLMGHQDGAYNILNNEAKPINSGQGAWAFKPIYGTGDIIAGTYTGLQLFKYTSGTFVNEGMVEGVYESLHNLASDDDKIIWSSHPFRGLYRFQLSADRKRIIKSLQYTDRNGLPSVLNNKVYFIKGKIVAATGKGIYEYNKNSDTFGPSDFFKPIFGDQAVEYMTEDELHNIWFVSNQRVGVIDFSATKDSPGYRVSYFPELAGQTVKSLEYIYPYNAENIFVGSNNGIFHLNYRNYVRTELKPNVLLTTVKAIAENDSLIFGGYFNKNSAEHTVSLTNHWNSFHFEYSSTLFAQKSSEEFSYMLSGFDKEWSKWSAKTEKDYTNLPYGEYTFRVKVRNNSGAASQPVSYTFIVLPAWYQTVWAYLFYTLCIIFTIYLLVQNQRKRILNQQKIHEEEQKRLSYLHSLELDRSDKEIIALKNDKLEADLLYKNKELATITMHLVDRGRILLNIKDELANLIKKLQMPMLTYEFRSVFRLLDDVDKKDDDWNTFSIYFDEVHNNFLSILKCKHPSLSSTDLKICAYLRLNLSSKEIAQLLNISLKGVEISRYRLRKKLQLSTEVNLYTFLTDLTGGDLS